MILFVYEEETQMHISNTFQMGRNVCIVYQRDPAYERFNSHSLLAPGTPRPLHGQTKTPKN